MPHRSLALLPSAPTELRRPPRAPVTSPDFVVQPGRRWQLQLKPASVSGSRVHRNLPPQRPGRSPHGWAGSSQRSPRQAGVQEHTAWPFTTEHVPLFWHGALARQMFEMRQAGFCAVGGETRSGVSERKRKYKHVNRKLTIV